jgi:hypothetical protein
MARLDIFDQHTWKAQISNEQEMLQNKVIGAIGQKIGELRSLKQKIKSAVHKENKENEDYLIADVLMEKNSAAYNLMDIKIDFNGDKTFLKLNLIIETINSILNKWKDVANRKFNYLAVIEMLRVVKPYMENSGEWNRRPDISVTELITPKISGNACWDLYLATQKQATYWYDNWKKLNEKCSALADTSDDDPDSSPESYPESDSVGWQIK